MIMDLPQEPAHKKCQQLLHTPHHVDNYHQSCRTMHDGIKQPTATYYHKTTKCDTDKHTATNRIKHDAEKQIDSYFEGCRALEAAAHTQTNEAMEKLLGPKRDNPVVQIMTSLLRKSVFHLPEHVRPEYFDVLSHVMDHNPDLVSAVKEISITRNLGANYAQNIFVFETVIGELVGSPLSLQKLTLNQFSAQEVIRILVTLKSQKELQYLNLCDNSLREDDLSFVVRNLPKSNQPLTLELKGNYLRDESYVTFMVSLHPNVRVHIGSQKENSETKS